MSKNGNSLEHVARSSRQTETKRGSYTSYNALAGRVEVKSVSDAMRDYIKAEFKKIERRDLP